MPHPNIEDLCKKAENGEILYSLQINKNTPPALQKELAKHEYGYGKLGLLVGVVFLLGGLLLCLNGVAGNTSWTAKFIGAESKISDAAPGVILFVIGLLVVWVTKPKFIHK